MQYTDQWESEQYNPNEVLQPITSQVSKLVTRVRMITRTLMEYNQVTYRAFGFCTFSVIFSLVESSWLKSLSLQDGLRSENIIKINTNTTCPLQPPTKCPLQLPTACPLQQPSNVLCNRPPHFLCNHPSHDLCNHPPVPSYYLKIEISQQPLIWSKQNWEFLEIKTCSNGRWQDMT